MERRDVPPRPMRSNRGTPGSSSNAREGSPGRAALASHRRKRSNLSQITEPTLRVHLKFRSIASHQFIGRVKILLSIFTV
jgi:hypothetical protein